MQGKEFTVTLTLQFKVKVWADNPHSPDWWQKRADREARNYVALLRADFNTGPYFQPEVSQLIIQPA